MRLDEKEKPLPRSPDYRIGYYQGQAALLKKQLGELEEKLRRKLEDED